MTKKSKISFNKKIYHRPAVDRAVKTFGKLAAFQVKEDKKSIIVFLETGADEETIGDEFANYVLAETISER